MAKVKRSEAQEKRLGKLREQDEKLRVARTLPDGTVIFRYVQGWQRGWSKGVTEDSKAYTYAMDSDGNVFGYCWKKPSPALAEYVTYPEKRRERVAVSTRKPTSGKGTKKGKAVRAVAKTTAKTTAKKKKVIAEDVALAGAA